MWLFSLTKVCFSLNARTHYTCKRENFSSCLTGHGSKLVENLLNSNNAGYDCFLYEHRIERRNLLTPIIYMAGSSGGQDEENPAQRWSILPARDRPLPARHYSQ